MEGTCEQLHKGGELPPAERFVCKKPMQVEK